MALIDEVSEVCKSLAPAGWRQLMLDVSYGKLDITSSNLGVVLAQDLDRVDRTIEGFEDFCLLDRDGQKPPFAPATRLLLHAFASPRVTKTAEGAALTAFPSLAQIDTLENYLFAERRYSLEQLKEDARNGEIGLAVFACEYRPAHSTLDKQAADFCFSRTGISRAGTAPVLYDPERRDFQPLVEGDPHAFRVMPVRYQPYLARRQKGEASVLPCHSRRGDEARDFWVPYHKVFQGPECIVGLDMSFSLVATHINEKLARLFRYLNGEGYKTGVPDSDLAESPFTMTDGQLAEFEDGFLYGPGLLVPQLSENQNLVMPAEFKDRPVTIHVAKDFEKFNNSTHRLSHYFDSLYVEPETPIPPSGGGSSVIPTGKSHRTPEIINARHWIMPDGTEINLNDQPDVYWKVREGGYDAQLYQDFTGDGSIIAQSDQLEGIVTTRVPAYSVIAAPDFFPYCHQLDQFESWHRAPKEIRAGLWAVPPYALCDKRYGPNIYIEAFGEGNYPGSGLEDKTITAIVPLAQSLGLKTDCQMPPAAPRSSSLPDSASGVFDPGWDITTDTPIGAEDNSNLFFVGYGLGSPYVEDAKICAALGTFWPAVAPDSTRTFAPYSYWPTVCPLTDEETGQIGDMPWDGVFGPKWIDGSNSPDGKHYVDYLDFNYVDYVDNSLKRQLTASLTAKVDNAEYERRVHAMAWVYWALGIHFPTESEDPGKSFFARVQDYLRAKAKWAVISFQSFTSGAEPTDPNFAEALKSTDGATSEPYVYRFIIYQWDKDHIKPNPNDFKRHLVEVLQVAQLYTDGTSIWCRRSETGSLKDAGPWDVQKIPTS